MTETKTLPTWFTELPPEAQGQVSTYLRTVRLRVTALEQKLERQGADQRRIIENRDADIARLEDENAALAARLKKKPKRPRAVEEMCDELMDWYGLAHLIIFRLQAIGEKYGVEVEETAPVESSEP